MAKVEANGLYFEIERKGDPQAPVLVLIMGLGMQLTAWPEILLDALVAGGYQLVLIDNRDCGRSSILEAAPTQGALSLLMRRALGRPVFVPYRLADMACDVTEVLKVLNISSFHLLGVSMGGMIAQHIAAADRGALRSLTAVMTSSGAPALAGPKLSTLPTVLARLPATASEARASHHFFKLMRTIGSKRYPVPKEQLLAQGRRAFLRGFYPDGVQRQSMAILVDGDRSALLAKISVPTLVVHGTEDPLVPKAGGIDLAAKVDKAQLHLVEGMGHDLPEPLMASFAALVLAHLDQSELRASGADTFLTGQAGPA